MKALLSRTRSELDSLKITTGIRIYPETELAAIAVAEGIITPEDDLLPPKFYLAPHLDGVAPGKDRCLQGFASMGDIDRRRKFTSILPRVCRAWRLITGDSSQLHSAVHERAVGSTRIELPSW